MTRVLVLLAVGLICAGFWRLAWGDGLSEAVGGMMATVGVVTLAALAVERLRR